MSEEIGIRILDELKGLKNGQTEIKEEVRVLRERVGSLEEGQEEIVARIEKDIGDLKKDVAGIKVEMVEMREEQKDIIAGVEENIRIIIEKIEGLDNADSYVYA